MAADALDGDVESIVPDNAAAAVALHNSKGSNIKISSPVPANSAKGLIMAPGHHYTAADFTSLPSA